jgi:hypothetical protein
MREGSVQLGQKRLGLLSSTPPPVYAADRRLSQGLALSCRGGQPIVFLSPISNSPID